ncbi:MAG: hypothetical protein EX285_01415 [Thaumarchaeota archaeon]|nr:hypothetical protein [Nitrososphaerota archaeon]
MTSESRKVIETKRNVVFVVMGAIGLILFWRGIWDISAKYFSEEVSLGIGFSILVVLAIVERRRLGTVYLK